ncbi:hypothetical protein [Halorubrum sp. HHNYT27]|uniref:hypothetical protein n=1 Tax=Halorubrum sp. HHNYT27 TaxID=3402275 RepID=UPI003EC06B5B
MRQDPIPTALADRLSVAARRLRAARQRALDRAAVEETEWEYAGRTWSWPAGEARTYFRELAPGEREVLDDLLAELDARREADGAGESAEVVGVGTGRVAVSLPGSVAEETRAADESLVAKLARYGPSAEMGDGRPQNRRERRIWSAVGSHPFLPVLGGDEEGDWIVMPRADVPPDEDVREAALERVRTALAPYRDRFHFDELKPENVGAYRGQFWIVDYGRPSGEPLFVEPPSASETGGSADSTGSDAGENCQDRSNKS